MPSTKHRINLTVPQNIDDLLQNLATRDHLSVSTKTLDLIKKALEIEEDETLLSIALAREKKSSKFISHAKAWK